MNWRLDLRNIAIVDRIGINNDNEKLLFLNQSLGWNERAFWSPTVEPVFVCY